MVNKKPLVDINGNIKLKIMNKKFMNKIKQGNLNFDGTGRAYPDNPEIKENWDCIWKNNGKCYILVGDNEHKEWEEIDIKKI